MQLSFADHNLTSTSEAPSFTRGVKRIVQYPTWQNTPGVKGDVAVVELDRPVSFGPHVMPVCLPWDMKNATFAGQVGVSVGWGLTEDGKMSDVLRKVSLGTNMERGGL